MRSEREQALIQETLATWQERYPIRLTEDEAQEIMANTTALFNLLAEWDQDSNATRGDEPTAEYTIGGEHAA